MLHLKGGVMNKVPVLIAKVTHANVKKLERLQHVALQRKQGVCYIPAYAPLLSHNLRDLESVFGTYTTDEAARKIISGYKVFMGMYKRGEMRPDFKYVFPPHQHQRQSLLDIIYNFRWNLSLDPGLGKTKIIIDYLRYISKSALVFAPSSLLQNWIEEFRKHSYGELRVTVFAEDVKPSYVRVQDTNGLDMRDENGKLIKRLISARVIKGGWLKDLDTDVLLVGYRSAALYKDEIMAHYDYDVAVCDESHRIKGWKSGNSEAARALSQKAYRRVTMSGTYILNSPIDAWAQLEFLAPQITNKTFYKFRDDYCTFHAKFKHQVVGFKNMDKLNKLISRVTTRYTKDDAVDMPGRTEIPVYYDLSAEQRKWYVDLLDDEDLLFADGNITKDHKITILEKVRQVGKGYVNLSNKDPQICDGCEYVAECIDNKIKPYTKFCNVVKKAPAPTVRRLKANPAMDACMDTLEDVLGDRDNKVIIYAKGTEEIKMIKERFAKMTTIRDGKSVALKFIEVLDAKTAIARVNAFEDDPYCRVLLCGIAKAIGFTANTARYAFYYSSGFSLEHYLQSRDRNYRLNTVHSVFEYHFIGNDTIDVPMYDALIFKQDVADTILQNMSCTICPSRKVCEGKGIIMYQKGCNFAKQAKRTTIKLSDLG